MNCDVASLRSRYPVMNSIRYFNWGSNGPLSEVFSEDLVRRQMAQLHRGVLVPHTMESELKSLDKLRRLLAKITGGRAENLVLCGSTTSAFSLALECLAPRAGGVAYVERFEHPAVLNPLRAQAIHDGFEVRTVETDQQGATRTQAWQRALESAGAGPDVVAVTSPVSWVDGSGLDVGLVVDLVKKLDGRVILDGAQTVGAAPVEFDRSGAAALCFPSQKWLCGPNGFGGLLLAEEHHQRALTRCGRRSYLPRDCLSSPIHQLEVQGLTWYFPALEAWTESLFWLQSQIEWAEVYRLTSANRDRLVNAIAASPILRRWRVPSSVHGGLVHLSLDSGQAQALSTSMLTEGWYVRSIPEPSGLRLSVSFLHSQPEIDELAGELERRLENI